MEQVNIQSHLDAAAKARKGGKLREAVRHLRTAERIDPQRTATRLTLAQVLVEARAFSQAESYLEPLVKSSPDDAQAWFALGRTRVGLGDLPRARAALQRAYELDGADLKIGIALSECLRQMKQAEKAGEVVERVLKKNPGAPEAVREKARVLEQTHREAEAIELLDPLLNRQPLDTAAFDLWAKLMRDQGRAQALEERLQGLVVRCPRQAEFWVALGIAKHRRGDMDGALACLEKANALVPNHARILYEMGVVKRFMGRIEESHELIGRSFQGRPDHPGAIRTYGLEHKYQYGDGPFQRINALLPRMHELEPADQVQLHYAAGKAFDDVNEYGASFSHYAVGGAKKRKIVHLDEANAARVQALMGRVFTGEFIERHVSLGYHDPTPVFVLGMPRSGTSLLEQVLSSHPAVFGAGELKTVSQVLAGMRLGRVTLKLGTVDGFFADKPGTPVAERGKRYVEETRKLAPATAQRIVDKMPGNYTHVGLIHVMLPDAKIIHSQRNPVDTCLSCYRTLFTEGQEWSYNLRELGRHYRHYWNLTNHWRQAMPGVMLEVPYELMVQDLEGQARRIIDYLGLEWTDACLRFYENERPVKTASASQVRKPIYASSVNRWKKYESYLKPLLEELGDIPAQYDAMLQKAVPVAA